MIRIGLVGKRTLGHVAGLTVPGVSQVTAFAERSPDARAQMAAALPEARAYSDFEEILAEVDAVMLGTPMHLHAPQAIAALRAGRHVLSEVTACTTLAQAEALRAAAAESRATYMLAENYCYIEPLVIVRELVRRGAFGNPYYAEGAYIHDVKWLHHTPEGGLTWRAADQVGVRGNTYITHSLGPVMDWFQAADPADRIDAVLCVGSGIHTDPEHPHDDTTESLIRTRHGRLARIRLDLVSNRPHDGTRYGLQGTTGCYESFGGGRIWLGTNPDPGYHAEVHREWQPIADYRDVLPADYMRLREEAAASGHGGGDFFVARDFVRTLIGEVENPLGLSRTLPWTITGLHTTTSIHSDNRWVAIPNDEDSERI
ncbi:MAG: Gfo/Idh/MocA family oxidoreductase [Fimbriimonadaceae bacterium]|nr:Gfo/Idh/MocA family oxidoreductase [Fimbriimonadaceae bacterium]